MTSATLAQPDTRRITEHDADVQRVRTRLEHDLLASVKRYVRELRSGDKHSAVSSFIQRHTQLLWAGYTAAWKEGAADYWASVSNQSLPQGIAPDPARVRRVMAFYVPSVAKMASELQQAARHTRLDELADAQSALVVRIGLQADLTWSAAQGGYYDGNLYDPANPFSKVMWDLEPLALHCGDCPEMAAGSPYDPPGSGGNELLQTPGDGHTACGAGCRCGLRYLGGSGEDGANLGRILPPNIPGMATLGDDLTVPMAQMSDLNARQKDALDGIRKGIRRWEKARGNLPSLPSPFDAEAALDLPEWDSLTSDQQDALEAFFNGLISWSVATNLANLDSPSTALTERHRAILLYSPDQLRIKGRFAYEGKGRQPSEAHAVQGYGRQERPISEMPHGQSKDMEAWLNIHRADQTWHVADVHPELLHEAVATLDRMKADYPDAHFRLEHVTTEGAWHEEPHAFAYVDDAGHSLHLNPKFWGDKAVLEEHVLDARTAGWLVNAKSMSPAEQVMTHEFGHIIDHELRGSDDAFEQVVSSTGLGKVSSTWNKLQMAMVGRLWGKVSDYAQKNDHEMTAEAFTALRAGVRLRDEGANEMLGRIRTFLGHAYHARYRYGSYKGMATATPEERAEAEKRLRHLADELKLSYP